jgi:hypothetical protein
MRKTPALPIALLAAASLLNGCSQSSPNQTASPKTTSNSTTANSNASSYPHQTEGGSYANTNSRPTTVGAPPPAGGGKPTGIKPPMKNENK